MPGWGIIVCWIYPATSGSAMGRAFTGTHGDGVLSANGFATNSDWLGYDGDDVRGAKWSGFVVDHGTILSSAHLSRTVLMQGEKMRCAMSGMELVVQGLFPEGLFHRVSQFLS